MIRIAERIWEYWRGAQERFDAEAVDLFFSSNLSPARALDALRRAATDVVRELGSPVSDAPGVDT